MLETLIKITWKKLPFYLRLRIIRLTQKKFTASVVAIVTNQKDEVLVLDHLIRPGSSWGLPGGFIEPNEDPEEAIRRELMEETGLELKEVKLIKIRTVRKHLEMLFRAEGVGKAEIKSREIKGLGWFTIDNFPARMSEVQKQLVRDILQDD